MSGKLNVRLKEAKLAAKNEIANSVEKTDFYNKLIKLIITLLQLKQNK